MQNKKRVNIKSQPLSWGGGAKQNHKILLASALIFFLLFVLLVSAENFYFSNSAEQPSGADGTPTVDTLAHSGVNNASGSFGASPGNSPTLSGLSCTDIVTIGLTATASLDSANYDPNSTATATLNFGCSGTGTIVAGCTDTFNVFRCYFGSNGEVCNFVGSRTCQLQVVAAGVCTWLTGGDNCLTSGTTFTMNTNMDNGGNITKYYLKVNSSGSSNIVRSPNSTQTSIFIKNATAYGTENSSYYPSEPGKNPASAVVAVYTEGGYDGATNDANGDGWDGNNIGDLKANFSLYDPDNSLVETQSDVNCDANGFCNTTFSLPNYAEAGTYRINYTVKSSDGYDITKTSSTFNVKLVINKTETKTGSLLNAVNFSIGEIIESWFYVMNPDDNNILQKNNSWITDLKTNNSVTAYEYNSTNKIVKFRYTFNSSDNATSTGNDFISHVNITMNGQEAITGDAISSKNALVHLFSCTPNLVNTSWGDWSNLTCSGNKMNQSRFLTQYDNNTCGEIANQTIYEYRNILDCGESPAPQTPSGGGGGGIVYECSKDKDCKEGYSCYNNKCTKLFDVEILKIESLTYNLNFSLIYLIKGMAEIKGDVIIKFWLEKENKTIMLGQDTIYLGIFEEKTKTTNLNLPLSILNGDYELHIQVSYENYSAESYRKLNINLPQISLEPESEENLKKKNGTHLLIKDYFILKLAGLLLVVLVLILIIFRIKKRKPKEVKLNVIPLESKPRSFENIKIRGNTYLEIKPLPIDNIKSKKNISFDKIPLKENILLKIKEFLSYLWNKHKKYLSNHVLGLISKEVYSENGYYIGEVKDVILRENRIESLKIKVDKSRGFRVKGIIISYRHVKNIKDIIIIDNEILEKLKSLTV